MERLVTAIADLLARHLEAATVARKAAEAVEREAGFRVDQLDTAVTGGSSGGFSLLDTEPGLALDSFGSLAGDGRGLEVTREKIGDCGHEPLHWSSLTKSISV